MKITLIHGQNHKGSTYHTARMAAERIGGDIDEYFLPKDLDKACVGCFSCMDKGMLFCPHHDQVGPIFDSMLSSDVIIIGSPTYALEMSGQLKSLFDHLFAAWLTHRPEERMFSKTAIVVSTAAGAGAAGVAKSLKKQLSWMGVPKIYVIAEKVAAKSWDTVSEKKKQEIGAKVDSIARKIIHNNGKARPGPKPRIMFSIFRRMQKKNDWAPLDKKYWEEKGWLGKARPWKK